MRNLNAYPLRRLALKLTILAAFALARGPSVFRANTVILFAFATVFDIGLALFRRDRLNHHNFTYWDEAAVFALLTCILLIA